MTGERNCNSSRMSSVPFKDFLIFLFESAASTPKSQNKSLSPSQKLRERERERQVELREKEEEDKKKEKEEKQSKAYTKLENNEEETEQVYRYKKNAKNLSRRFSCPNFGTETDLYSSLSTFGSNANVCDEYCDNANVDDYNDQEDGDDEGSFIYISDDGQSSSSSSSNSNSNSTVTVLSSINPSASVSPSHLVGEQQPNYNYSRNINKQKQQEDVEEGDEDDNDSDADSDLTTTKKAIVAEVEEVKEIVEKAAEGIIKLAQSRHPLERDMSFYKLFSASTRQKKCYHSCESWNEAKTKSSDTSAGQTREEAGEIGAIGETNMMEKMPFSKRFSRSCPIGLNNKINRLKSIRRMIVAADHLKNGKKTKTEAKAEQQQQKQQKQPKQKDKEKEKEQEQGTDSVIVESVVRRNELEPEPDRDLDTETPAGDGKKEEEEFKSTIPTIDPTLSDKEFKVEESATTMSLFLDAVHVQYTKQVDSSSDAIFYQY